MDDTEIHVLPSEIFGEISEHIQEGSTWKAFTQSCKTLYSLNTPAKINRYSNHLMTLLIKHPNGIGGRPWNMDVLSSNLNLPWSFVEAHLDGIGGWSWDMRCLSSNPNLPWDMRRLSSNINLPWSFVEAHLDGIGEQPWDIDWLSKR